MPTYPCEKCGRVFKQKSGYIDHMNKKVDCSQNTIISTVIEKKVEEKVKEVVRVMNPYAELTLPSDSEQRRAYLQTYFEAIHNLLWNRAGLNPEKALEHLTFFFAYRLIEAQADTLNLPQECRWSFLASHKNENDTYETMKKGCIAFQKNKVTKAFFKKPEIEKADVIFEVVQQINRIPIKAIQEADTLGDIFEYMLGRGMSTMSDEGQYFTNRAICRLAFKLSYEIKKTLRKSDGSLCTFADWFCGTGGFPAEYVKGVKENLVNVDWKKESAAIYCQDMNLSSITTTLLNLLILTGIPFSGDKIRSANSFTDSITFGNNAPFKGVEIDYCFMNPPYGGDKTKGKEYKFAYAKGKGTEKKYLVNPEIQSIGIEDDDKVSAGVQLAMATLAPGGVCAIVLPQGFFFGASKKAIELRKKLAEEYRIHFVVDIASGSFINTGTKTSMMVFQKGVGSTQIVKFLDMNEKVLIEAGLANLREKNYSLNYKQYLPQETIEIEGFEVVKLESLLKEKKYPKHPTEYGKEVGKYRFHTGAESTKLYTDTPDIDDIVIIINRTNGSGKSHIFLDSKCSVAGQTITFSCKNDITTRYIYYYLKSNIKILEDGYVGANHKNLTIEHVNNIDIPLPSLERQQEIVAAIDVWNDFSRREEEMLAMLEKQMMFYVKEMGKGKERVKLKDIAKDITFGFMVSSQDYGTEGIPVIKTKNIKSKRVSYPASEQKIQTKLDERYKVKKGDLLIVLGGSPGENGMWEFDEEAWLNQDCAKISIENPITKMFVFYSLQGQVYDDYIESNTTKTTIGHISRGVVREIEIPLPSLAEQQTLQSDFDEIRHKHAKIAEYKAKAQEAIKRLIPGASTV